MFPKALEIAKTVKVPTGEIHIVKGDKGLLECLSIGDYGKDANINAEFLGLTKEIHGVANSTPLLPLSEKWVCTISTQYGCSMNCAFCDVPKVGRGINATFDDLVGQVFTVLDTHKEVKETKRFNLHYARMGEPSFNFSVISSAYYLKGVMDSRNFHFHPVVSTMVPHNNSKVWDFIYDWLKLKNDFGGEAGLQISVNSTDTTDRSVSMPFATDIDTVAYNMGRILSELGFKVKGRKITLNFALSDKDSAKLDAKILSSLFDPKYFLIKITPIHETKAAVINGIVTSAGYYSFAPYRGVRDKLKAEGYDVIIFIPSEDEDASRITCGNAILSDRK